MFCTKCGAQLAEGTKFCTSCGAQLGQGVTVDSVVNGAQNVFNKAEDEIKSAIGDVAGAGQQQYQQQQQQYQGGAQTPPPAYGAPQGAAPQGGGYTPNPGTPYTGERLKEDRSLGMYILLSIVTCGIYSYYFLYKMAADVNVACAGDGETTTGLVGFILLSFITCGIYAFIWQYKLANRLASNAPRYGMSFQENGTTVLMWDLFGALLCGIGPYIAMNILIKNSNSICIAYNRYNNR